MKILIIDGQGGGLGKALISALKSASSTLEIIAVGTNSIAGSAMKKAGADIVATGENAVIVNSRKADIIAGPLGIIAADALYGEITPAMAAAIAQSDATKILIPFNSCGIFVVGVAEKTAFSQMIDEAVQKILSLC